MLSEILHKLAVAKQATNSVRRFTVCETGFAAGHSAALWLSSHPSVDVVSFDMFDRPYQQKCTHFRSFHRGLCLSRLSVPRSGPEHKSANPRLKWCSSRLSNQGVRVFPHQLEFQQRCYT